MLSEEELDSSVYPALAKSIGLEFGLYSNNEPLIESCRSYLEQEYDPWEDLAMVIIKELWNKVCRNQHLRLVKA